MTPNEFAGGRKKEPGNTPGKGTFPGKITRLSAEQGKSDGRPEGADQARQLKGVAPADQSSS
jgi:hypothetical protein